MALALSALVTVGLMAACGDDDPSAVPTTTQQAAVSLPRISVGQSAAQAASTAGGRSAVATESDVSTDAAIRLAWTHYSVDGELAATPPAGTAWVIRSGRAIDAAQMAQIAAAFGITAPVTEVPAEEGGGWRAGPNDGTAPSITFPASPMLDWYFSPAWATVDSGGIACAEPLPAPDAPVDGEADVRAGCETPLPPANVPTAEQAMQRARDLLSAAGLDLSAMELTVEGDEWGRYVTAYPLLGGVRSPLATSVGFGAEGAITWAGGTLAQPEAVGEYPLISPAAGVARLNEQSAGWAAAATAEPAAETVTVEPVPVDTGETSVGEPLPPESGSTEVLPAEPLPDDSVTIDPVPAEPLEVVITGVRLELTMIIDVDGTVWLLPAFGYTNATGPVATIPAVTDEYLVVTPDAQLDVAVSDAAG